MMEEAIRFAEEMDKKCRICERALRWKLADLHISDTWASNLRAGSNVTPSILEVEERTMGVPANTRLDWKDKLRTLRFSCVPTSRTSDLSALSWRPLKANQLERIVVDLSRRGREEEGESAVRIKVVSSAKEWWTRPREVRSLEIGET